MPTLQPFDCWQYRAPTSARVTMVTRARAEICIVHKDKSARKGRRMLQFSFWNYTSTFLLWTIQNSQRARARWVAHPPRGSPEILSAIIKGSL